MLFVTAAAHNTREEQEASEWWRPIIKGLGESSKSAPIRRLIKNFEMRNDALYRRTIINGVERHRLCLTPGLIEQVLLVCHDDVTAGHLGVARTVDKIRRRYYWPKMERQITNYVLSCVDCQTRKRPQTRPTGLLMPISAQKPFEKVGIDLIGPFPLSLSGNRHVIIAVDYFTKWVIAQPVPRADAKAVVDFFLKRVVLQHGAPSFLISDRGKWLTANSLRSCLRRCRLTIWLRRHTIRSVTDWWSDLITRSPSCCRCM